MNKQIQEYIVTQSDIKKINEHHQKLRLALQSENKNRKLRKISINGSPKIIDFLSVVGRLSSREMSKVKKSSSILLNGDIAGINSHIKAGDEIQIDFALESNTFEPEPIKLEILYEDEHVIVVNKPPFLVVHPTKNHPSGTLINGLSYIQHQRGENYKIRLINRLDRDTSGLVLIAKTSHAQNYISKQMQEGRVLKLYLALCENSDLLDGVSFLEYFESESVEPSDDTITMTGYTWQVPESSIVSASYSIYENWEYDVTQLYRSEILSHSEDKPVFRIDAPIKRLDEDDVLRGVSVDGQNSVTLFREVVYTKKHRLLEACLVTGRTHQIRVHLSHIGLPIVADHLYGHKSPFIDRQALHCHYLEFDSLSGERVKVRARVPQDFYKALEETLLI